MTADATAATAPVEEDCADCARENHDPAFACHHRYRPDEYVFEYIEQLLSYVMATVTRRSEHTYRDVSEELEAEYERAALEELDRRYHGLVPWEVSAADEAALIEPLATLLIERITTAQAAASERARASWRAWWTSAEARVACGGCGHAGRAHMDRGTAFCNAAGGCRCNAFVPPVAAASSGDGATP
jgi:hypothetical protein